MASPSDGRRVSTFRIGRRCRTGGPATPRSLALACLAAWGLVAAPPAQGAEHLIAAVATRGSVHQPFGGDVVTAVERAVSRFNAEDGVLGAKLRVTAWTEDCTRERAAEVAGEIARQKPVVVIGHLCAGAAIVAAGIYAKAGVLLIAPGVRHPALTDVPGGLVLRLAGRDDRFASDTVRLIASRFSGRGIAVVADRTRQARALADGVVAEAARQGVSVRLDERIESGEKSYAPVAARIKASGAGVVVMPAQPIELGVLIASLRHIGVGVPVVGSDILAVPALEPTARREAGRLVLMMPWTGLEAGAGRNPDPARDRGRDAVMRRAEAAVEIWAAAARRAGTTEPSAVARAARLAPAKTTAGEIVFDETGDAVVPGYVASTWRDGAWRPISTAPRVPTDR